MRQGILLNWSCSLEGLGSQGIKYFCWGVLCFSLGMASLVLTDYNGPSLASLSIQDVRKQPALGLPRRKMLFFLMLLLSLSNYPVLGPGFPC